jgi:aspartyl-tRNA(Asn)/glutamyl-tRNA(Gln) amidotransferase subunit B
MHPDYEMVIGLEVHAQINTVSKLFSGASTAFGAAPNTQACAIDLGMPGMLPVLNEKAVDAGIKLGLAIGAAVNPTSVFARKNYYYPDLPKGYQISQYEKPIVSNGMITIDLEDGSTKDIGVERMHLEEDAGKSVHDIGSDSISHVDLNRAGIPLMEIVSRPDLRTPEEAGAYVKKLRAILRFIDVCDGNMEQGSLRCDANVSVRKKGVEAFGTRCEIKNLNSIRNVMRAIYYEADRQTDVLEGGGTIEQQTRLWDANKNETRAMRGKEDAHDYRYFADPDILPLRIDGERITRIRETMPELPDQMKDRFMSEFGLSGYDASVLTMSRENASYYEALLGIKNGKPARDPKACANWMTVELFGALNKSGKDITESPVAPRQLGALVDMMADETISGKIAKQVFAEMLETSADPQEIVEKQGLQQITDTSELEAIVQKVIKENPETVAKYKGGNEKVFGFFVGQVMKETQGKANPAIVNSLLKKFL